MDDRDQDGASDAAEQPVAQDPEAGERTRPPEPRDDGADEDGERASSAAEPTEDRGRADDAERGSDGEDDEGGQDREDRNDGEDGQGDDEDDDRNGVQPTDAMREARGTEVQPGSTAPLDFVRPEEEDIEPVAMMPGADDDATSTEEGGSASTHDDLGNRPAESAGDRGSGDEVREAEAVEDEPDGSAAGETETDDAAAGDGDVPDTADAGTREDRGAEDADASDSPNAEATRAGPEERSAGDEG